MTVLESPMVMSADNLSRAVEALYDAAETVMQEYLQLCEFVGQARYLIETLSVENAELRGELLWLRESVKQAHETEVSSGDD